LRRVFRIAGYPTLAVFIIAGLAVVVVTLSSLNLLTSGLALLRFVQQHGWTAIMVGGWRQMLEIAGYGAVSLSFYLLFKVCETELLIRYRNWQDR